MTYKTAHLLGALQLRSAFASYSVKDHFELAYDILRAISVRLCPAVLEHSECTLSLDVKCYEACCVPSGYHRPEFLRTRCE